MRNAKAVATLVRDKDQYAEGSIHTSLTNIYWTSRRTHERAVAIYEAHEALPEEENAPSQQQHTKTIDGLTKLIRLEHRSTESGTLLTRLRNTGSRRGSMSGGLLNMKRLMER
jgi:hypothetical protein